MTLRYLLQKEFIQIRRNPFLPRLIILFPILIMCVMPWVMNLEVKHIAVDVVDNDRSTGSQQLVQSIAVSKYFSFHGQPSTYREALRDIERSQADIVLVIPHGYSRDLTLGRKPQILIAANAVNGTHGILGSTYLSSVLHDYASELRQAGVGSAERGAYTALPTFTLQSQYQFNPHLDYKAFMVPGLMVMLLTMLTGFLPALNIVGEKETGTIEQMNVSPVRPWTLILSKLIPYWTLGLFVLMLAMGLAATLFGLTPAGGIGNILAFTLLYLLVMSGLGICVSNIAGTMQQAMFVMYFFMMLFFLMSGLFTPITSMPQWAQMLTYLNPLRYFVQAMRSIYLKGSGLMDLLPQLGALVAYALASCSLALLSYRKRS